MNFVVCLLQKLSCFQRAGCQHEVVFIVFPVWELAGGFYVALYVTLSCVKILIRLNAADFFQRGCWKIHLPISDSRLGSWFSTHNGPAIPSLMMFTSTWLEPDWKWHDLCPWRVDLTSSLHSFLWGYSVLAVFQTSVPLWKLYFGFCRLCFTIWRHWKITCSW